MYAWRLNTTPLCTSAEECVDDNLNKHVNGYIMKFAQSSVQCECTSGGSRKRTHYSIYISRHVLGARIQYVVFCLCCSIPYVCTRDCCHIIRGRPNAWFSIARVCASKTTPLAGGKHHPLERFKCLNCILDHVLVCTCVHVFFIVHIISDVTLI